MALPLAIYARVSTTDQHAEVQLAELRAYAGRRGGEFIEFIDQGVSGRKDSRPALDKMMAAAKRREISAVAIVRLDRLGRSVLHLAKLAEEFESLGIELISLHEAIDTSTASGKMMFGMFSLVAEFEANLIRERTLAGLEAARKRGSIIGRPPALTAAQRRRVARLRSSGKSLRQIATQLEVGVATVQRVLQG
jgi:DNA invertase Pin-like site-specific DNA recombinase